MGNIAPKRNNSIDVMRLICAILVVAIHTHPFYDISSELGVLGTIFIPRVAVPFFFCVSGYFFIKKIEEGTTNYWKTVNKVIKIYLFWSIPYLAINILGQVVDGVSVFKIVTENIINVLIKGSYYHFWYFPALIISMIITLVIYKLGKLKLLLPISIGLYIIGCFLRTYYTFVQYIPGVSNFCDSIFFVPVRSILLMGIPYFCGGYLLNRLVNKELENKKKLVAVILVLCILFLVEIVFVYKTNVYYNDIAVTFFLYPLVLSMILFLLKTPMNEDNRLTTIAEYSHKLANVIFYIHPLVKLIFVKAFKLLFNIRLEYTGLFLTTLVVSLTIGYILCKLNIKVINRFLV